MSFGIRTLEFQGRTEVGAGAQALRFTSRRPVGHTAGRHAFWSIPRGGIAPFTIASAPDEPQVVLATNTGTHSRLKRSLGALEPGARVRLAGPVSSFTLDGAGRDVVMLAQGIGITPFRAMLTHLALTRADVAATLIHVSAAQGPHRGPFVGHPYRGDTEATAKEAFYASGREEFTAHLDAVAAARPDATFLVAGAAAFVNAVTTALTVRGVSRDRIRRDAFYGWTTPRT